MTFFFAQLTSLLSLIGMFLVLRAFGPLVKQDLDPFGRDVVVAVLFLNAATVIRSVWWDWGWILLGGNWPSTRDFFGGLDFNALPNVLVCYAMYRFLSGRRNAIPEKDRNSWKWYDSWTHPKGNCVVRLFRKDKP